MTLKACGSIPILALVLAGGNMGSSVSAASIEFCTFSVGFPELTAFRITMGAQGSGVDVGSYGMRTDRKATVPLPGLQLRGKYQYLVIKGVETRTPHTLLDNGPADEDVAQGVFTTTVPTVGWPDGVHTFLCYADNRPAAGAYVAARKRIRITSAFCGRVATIDRSGRTTQCARQDPVTAAGAPFGRRR